MAERGLSVAHTTIMRWVLKLVPTIEQRSRKYARPVGRSWRVDETYIKIKGRWVYALPCGGQGRSDGGLLPE
jgi:transposase-like protein